MSAYEVDYEEHGGTYTRFRRTDPHIASTIREALGNAETVLNVGAGAGSYEPSDRWVLAVEPSATMRAQRPPGAAPAIDARAEALPLDDDAVDAAMACVTIHHWRPPARGLSEMRRVARGPVVIFTFDLDRMPAWQLDYLHEALAVERQFFPSLDEVAGALGGRTRIERLRTPGNCADGFNEAYWRRPEALLDPAVRACQSTWARIGRQAEARIIHRLEADLRSGEWDRQHGHLRDQESFDGSLALVISEP